MKAQFTTKRPNSQLIQIMHLLQTTSSILEVTRFDKRTYELSFESTIEENLSIKEQKESLEEIVDTIKQIINARVQVKIS